MKTLYLCAAGNPEAVRLAINVNKAHNRWDKIVILDDDSSRHNTSILGCDVVGTFSMLAEADAANDEVSNMVARSTKSRLSAGDKIQSYGVPYATLIDPGVDMFGVEHGRDITVYLYAICCARSCIDEGSVVLMRALVGHGAMVGKGCIIAPGAVINARVEIGNGVYVGSNASVLPDLKIGPGATIGANSAVVQDVPAGATVMGVPAQVLIPGNEDLSYHSSSTPHTNAPDSRVINRSVNKSGTRGGSLERLRSAQKNFLASSKIRKTK